MIPMYNTKKFCDFWNEEGCDSAELFLEDWKDCGLYSSGLIKDTSITTLYYLLYSHYANNPIANFDENQFKYKIWSIIFEYGPTWEKRLEIQAKLRALTEDDIVTGAKTIYNHAYNPSTEPSTDSTDALPFINDQNQTHFKKTKLDGYANLAALLETDVTEEFIARFKGLFKLFARPVRNHIFVTDLVEDGEDEQ